MNKSAQKKKSPLYFKPDSFVDEVFKALKIDPREKAAHAELREEVVIALGDRIMATIFNNFAQREIKLFEQMLQDHPELDPIDAVMIIAPQIEGLTEALERNINSLYYELVRDADKIQELMNAKVTL